MTLEGVDINNIAFAVMFEDIPYMFSISYQIHDVIFEKTISDLKQYYNPI